MNDLKTQQFEKMYSLIETFASREHILTAKGHLSICSSQSGPPEECHICREAIRCINLLNEIDKSETRIQNECE